MKDSRLACSGTVSMLAAFVFTLVVSLPVVAADPGAAAARERHIASRSERLREVANVHRRNLARVMRARNVVASGTGLDANGEPVIRVFLERAGSAGLPAALDGVRLRTSVSGRVYALRSPTCDVSGDLNCAGTEAWPLPVPIGVSVGHPAITAGTIGARATDGANVFILSNNHVLANVNQAGIGDPIIQPGAFDGGVTAEDAIATLADFEPIEFCVCTLFFFGICWATSCPVSNQMDAAIALSSPGELGVSTSTGEYGSLIGYGVPSSQPHAAFGNPAVLGDENLFSLLGAPVTKVGRTTGLTSGTVDAVAASVNVCYDSACLQQALFADQIIITPGTFSSGGDSGSLIVADDASRAPVGLLFAGSTAQTIANRIDLVLNRFNVTIDDGGAIVSLTDAGVSAIAAPGSQSAGETATVSVTVTNFGNQTIGAQAIEVSLADATEPGAVAGGPLVVEQELAPGAAAQVDFDWQPTLLGQHLLDASLTLAGDENAANDTSSASANVIEPGLAGPQLQLRNLTARTDAWTTVDLDFDYGDEMVVVCSPVYDLATNGPALVRVRNAAGSSFEVGIARPWFGAFDFEQFAIDVHCLAVREGVYSLAEHGVSMEAVRLEGFASTDRAGSWSGEAQAYLNPAGYSAPVVLGQVVSPDDGLVPSNCPAAAGNICDPVWSAFWSRGSSRTRPASATTLYVGRHSGEDPAPRGPETLTYVVIESGNGAIEGRGYVAALGADTVRGMQNNPPFSYPLAGLTAPVTAIVGQAAMDGGNGGWALLYGSGGLSAAQLRLAIDEDWYLDSERLHTTEQVYYLVFE